MFTGIIEFTAPLVRLDPAPHGATLLLDLKPIASELSPGQSIAVSGVCLTLARLDIPTGHAGFDVIPETLSKTTLGSLVPGRRVNIERCVRADGRLDGHIVQGHVDGLARVVDLDRSDGQWKLWLTAADDLLELIAPRGSVALEGVSLTVAQVRAEQFAVALIPTTLERTNLADLGPGSAANLETDIVARQIAHWLSRQAPRPVGKGASP